MSGNPRCTVFIGNVDARVSDRVLYDILIQAGRLVEFYVPKDKETDRPKGYAFAEYESEEIADYCVRLFSGLVTLYNRTLKFAVHRLNEESIKHQLIIKGYCTDIRCKKTTQMSISSGIACLWTQNMKIHNLKSINNNNMFLILNQQ